MKTLYLLRHAKSDWGNPGLDDHDRALAPRGERAASVMGVHFAQQQYQPTLVLCSSALRTRQTLEALLPHLPGHPELVIEERIYLASGGQLDALSEEAKEAIEDLQQIARAEISSPGQDAGESEEDEVAFSEIVEFVRVVALMMREDFRGPGQDEAIH